MSIFKIHYSIFWRGGLLALIFALFNTTVQAEPFPLDVQGGFGSGDFEPGTEVFIEAYPYDDSDPLRVGQEPVDVEEPIRLFDRWMGNTQGVANVYSARTRLIMPESSVMIWPTYKDGFRWVVPQVVSEIPPNHTGILFMFHGAGGNARTLWSNEEIRLFLQEALVRGIGVVALDSFNRFDKQWDDTVDPTLNIDVQRTAEVRRELIADGRISAFDPVYVLGISNGGLAASLFDQNAQTVLDFPVEAAAMYISSGILDVMETTTVPTIFALAESDDANFPAMIAFDSLVSRGIVSQYLVNPSRPIFPGSFWRNEGLSLSDSEAIYDALQIAGFIDEFGYILDDPKTSGWEAFIPAFYSEFQLPVSEQLKAAYGAHGFFADLNKEVLDFLENPTSVFEMVPTVTGFDPLSAVPGAAVTIFGDHFVALESVTFGGVSAEFTVTGTTQIRTDVPVGASTGVIAVTNSVGTALSPEDFVVEGPTVDTMVPSSGPSGTIVTISGSGFVLVDTVTFGGLPAEFTEISGGQIRATVPVGAVTGTIAVSNYLGAGVSSGDFVVDGPIIDSIAPSNGPPGTSVTILGSGFVSVDTVSFGGIPADFTVFSSSQIRATVPLGAVTGAVTVSNNIGSGVSSGDFVVDGPIIDSIAPSNGPPGTSVTILGNGFVSVDTVSFGGVPANFTVYSGGHIRATVPLGAVTGAVTVSNNIGTGSSTDPFVVEGPEVTSFSPTSGSVNTRISITGSGFNDLTSVKLGGITMQVFFSNSNKIWTKIPSGATTGVFEITTGAGSATSSAAFVVTP